MGGEDKLSVVLYGERLGTGLPGSSGTVPKGRFVDDGANYQNASHNASKMEAIYAVVI